MGEIIDPVSRRLIAYTITGLFENANRTIWLDGRPHPSEFAEHLWNGFSTGEWENGMLKVTTTHMKQAFIQRNGIPIEPVCGDDRVLHPPRQPADDDFAGGRSDLSRGADGPLVERGDGIPDQREGAIGQVEIAEELPDLKPGDVPHYPLGTRHPEYADANGLPFEATLGGKETLYPEYIERLKEMTRAMEREEGLRRSGSVGRVRLDPPQWLACCARYRDAARRMPPRRRIAPCDRPTPAAARSRFCRCRDRSTCSPARAATSPCRSDRMR